MKKYISKIKNIIFEYSDIGLLFVLTVILEFIARKYMNLGFGKLPLIFVAKNLMFICSILCLFRKKQRICFEIIVILLLTIYTYAQTLHYLFFNTLFSFKKITVLGELGSVFSEIFVKINISHLLFVVPLVILILYFNLIDNQKQTINYKIKVFISIFMILSSLSLNALANKHLQNSEKLNDWMSDRYLLEQFQNKLRFYDRFGTVEFVFKDIKNIYESQYISNKNLSQYEIEELDTFIKEHSLKKINNMTGVYEGKNLILILAESLCPGAISEELTPTLYHIANNGYYFANHYAPIYQSSTGDSEFISLTSMIPSVDYGTTSYTFYNNYYPFALPKLFNQKGYHSNSYHSFISNFYNRELFHDSLGFDSFYGLEHLSLQFEWYYQESYNWHNDDKLFEATIKNTKFEDDNKIFNFVITASGHMPYELGREELYVNIDKINNSSYGDYSEESKCYLASQINFDNGLSQLMFALEQLGELNDTIIIIFGDHYPYGISKDESINEIIGSHDYQKYKVPFIIYDPSNENGVVIEKITSTFDIYPTICNLFNLDTEGAYVVGKDAFSNEKTYVPFIDRSVLTDDFYFDSVSGQTNIISEHYSEEEYNRIMSDVESIFDCGQSILSNNYYSEY